MSRKGLFLFCGESFREGFSDSRLRDTSFGVQNQTESSLSHMKLADHLKSLNYDIDVGITTYATPNQEMLKGFYKNIVFANFKDTSYAREVVKFNAIVEVAIHTVLSNISMDKYSFIFICRLDLLLKDDFIRIFNPEITEITYPNIMSIAHNDFNNTCISDLFVFIPRKYFHPFDTWGGIIANAKSILDSNSYVLLVQRGLSLRDLGFFSDMIYIANTFQLKNPLYAINCRPEGPSFVPGWSDLKYVKETHSIIPI